MDTIPHLNLLLGRQFQQSIGWWVVGYIPVSSLSFSSGFVCICSRHRGIVVVRAEVRYDFHIHSLSLCVFCSLLTYPLFPCKYRDSGSREE